MKKRFLSLALTVILALSLAAPAVAYTTPDFSDVPKDHWAYDSVMKMADQEIFLGTGGGMFSPELKVSASQFLTLIGRVAFPDTKVTEDDTWYGPYMEAAQTNGLLTGTQVDINQPEADITRYDMAAILAKVASQKNLEVKKVDQSVVKDYGEIPTKYVDAVLTVYGAGLIKGDGAGNFNGTSSMTRQEAATVMDRLLSLVPGGTTTEPDQPEQPTEPETIHTVLSITCYKPEAYEVTSEGKRTLYGIPVELRYTEDGGKTSQLIAECTSYDRGSYNFVSLEADIDKALVDNENGQFYLSAETTYEGQRLVTHDRRTDGRATIFPIDVQVKANRKWVNCDLDLVPPTGFKRDITIQGRVLSNAFVQERMPNIVVDLVLYRNSTGDSPDETDVGVILASTTSDENGEFIMEANLDTLDFFLGGRQCYRIEAHGDFDGKAWVSDTWRLEPLVRLTSLDGRHLPIVSIQMKPT